ncbi:hypothetical protein FLAG1_07281 [Fusarium langsethiae]|uniref:Uncharacterized protein n=1 Tax=Fusarium langsethiae TaxID=179993 RepID=A0A0N0DDL3_FUSLA|nr:hypothetical protein FLAG1_07281 [Fusarium langsethiae]GKU04641.1 unnamed protein product [Fusarium langsethiae]GKU20127.1 unnamed protein product [Fusarium langsethiae]
MPSRASSRLRVKKVKHSPDCLSISPKTKQVIKVMKSKPTKRLSEEQLKATKKVAMYLAEPVDHDKLQTALAEARVVFPLPSDLDLCRPLSELTREQLREYLEILEQRRDEMAT